MAPNIIFTALGIPNKYIEKTMIIKLTIPPCSTRTSLDISPPPKLLSLHCKQTNKLKHDLDGQPSSLLACLHVSNYKTTSSLTHLVCLELDTHRPHLDFAILDNNEVIPRTSPIIK